MKMDNLCGVLIVSAQLQVSGAVQRLHTENTVIRTVATDL